MPMKATGRANDYEEIDRWDGGVGWIAHPEETMQRASHALVDGEDVWVVDPVDASGLDDLLSGLGEVAGVVVTLGRHTRDAETIATRHGVAVHFPGWIDRQVDAPVRRFDDRLGDTEYRAIRLIDVPGWHEAALYDESSETLVVGDALGTADYFTTGRERLGVHPMLRLFPPRRLGDVQPRRILVGHGPGIFENASDALRDALAGSRRRFPGAMVEAIRTVI